MSARYHVLVDGESVAGKACITHRSLSVPDLELAPLTCLQAGLLKPALASIMAPGLTCNNQQCLISAIRGFTSNKPIAGETKEALEEQKGRDRQEEKMQYQEYLSDSIVLGIIPGPQYIANLGSPASRCKPRVKAGVDLFSCALETHADNIMVNLE